MIIDSFGKKQFRILILIKSLIFISSCSQVKVNSVANSVQQNETSLSNFEGNTVYKVKDDNTCDGCIRGAYSENIHSANAVEKKVYALEDQSDFNLKNTSFDFPVVYNQSTKKWINYFIGRGRNSLLRYLELSGRYAPFMAEMLDERGMPRDLIFLAMAESGFQNHAKSHARAVGPWQFIAPTGKKFGLKINWYVDERKDPIKATIAASTYLRDLYNMFGSWELAAAAYNAGEGKISRAVRKYASDDFWKISKNRFLKSETRNYVPKIMALSIIGKNLEVFGLEEIDFKDSLEFELVTIPPLTDLIQLAESTGWDLDELQLWNPELIRWFSPPGLEYKLRTPVGMSNKVQNYIASLNGSNSKFQKYEVSKGTNFNEISKKYRIPAEVLLDLNEEKKDLTYLKKGEEVLLPFREGQHGRERMYADLYEKVRSRKSRRNFYDHIANAKRKGPLNFKVSQYYVVKSGDTLWDVSKKTGVPLETLIRANLGTVENGLKPGVRLAVR
jgi:membrane-bound lytic murein transglycosylase D